MEFLVRAECCRGSKAVKVLFLLSALLLIDLEILKKQGLVLYT